MKILVLTALVLTLGACASQREESKPAEQAAAVVTPAAYEGHCPMGLCLKKSVKGDERYSVDYKGQHYIFSSPEARDNFISRIDNNIKKANKEWAANTSADRVR